MWECEVPTGIIKETVFVSCLASGPSYTVFTLWHQITVPELAHATSMLCKHHRLWMLLSKFMSWRWLDTLYAQLFHGFEHRHKKLNL